MKVKVWVEAEAEANVSLDDVMAEMIALPYSERQTSILNAVNTAHGILKRVSDERIAEMDDKQRGIIGNALREQSERYVVPNKELNGAPETETKANE